MSAPESDKLIMIGRVGKSHGLFGEVAVIPSTDDPGRFALLHTVWIGPDANRVRPFKLESARQHIRKIGMAMVVKLSSISSRDDAMGIKGSVVYALESDLPLEEDELFFHDLIGCSVFDTTDNSVGEVVDVRDIGTQVLLIVKLIGGEKVQIPYIDVFIKEVDEKEGRIVIDPIDGLI